MLIWRPNNNKRRHNDVITKNNGKIRTSAKPNKIYIIWKLLMRAIQKCAFYWIWATVCQILALFTLPANQIWLCHVPKMQISKIFYFVRILHLILGKVTKFPVENLSTSEVISKKPNGWGVENTPLRAFRVKESVISSHESMNIQWNLSNNY